jgi:hypothetical protein
MDLELRSRIVKILVDLRIRHDKIRVTLLEGMNRFMKFFNRKSIGYICSCCGKRHKELPMSYGSNAPYYWFQTIPEERDVRFDLNSDLCVMDDEHYFIRGNIEISVFEEKQVFIWDVWVSLSKDNFKKAVSTWSKSGREKELEPMFG